MKERDDRGRRSGYCRIISGTGMQRTVIAGAPDDLDLDQHDAREGKDAENSDCRRA